MLFGVFSGRVADKYGRLSLLFISVFLKLNACYASGVRWPWFAGALTMTAALIGLGFIDRTTNYWCCHCCALLTNGTELGCLLNCRLIAFLLLMVGAGSGLTNSPNSLVSCNFPSGVLLMVPRAVSFAGWHGVCYA